MSLWLECQLNLEVHPALNLATLGYRVIETQ